MSDGGPRRFAGPLSEVELIASLADHVLGSDGPIDWQTLTQTREIRQVIARVVPGWEAMAQLDQTRQEFYVGGRILHTPQFPTPTGKALLHAHTLPPSPPNNGSLRLMTVRSEGQFNTVVYEQEDIYRGQERRDVILLHPDDLDRLGLQQDQRVTVRSQVGRLEHVLARAFPAIRPGNALMYFPEANVLVPRTVDPQSRTPAFKCVEVTVES
jgi:anaerobic selenocysteine-containing dehydrogenase